MLSAATLRVACPFSPLSSIVCPTMHHPTWHMASAFDAFACSVFVFSNEPARHNHWEAEHQACSGVGVVRGGWSFLVWSLMAVVIARDGWCGGIPSSRGLGGSGSERSCLALSSILTVVFVGFVASPLHMITNVANAFHFG